MKKNIIGIQANFQDLKGITNETSVSMVKDGVLQHAIAEERISRVKLDGRFPHNAIKEIMKLDDVKADDIDVVAVPFLHPSKSNYKYYSSAWKTFWDTGVFLGKKIRQFGWWSLYHKLKTPKKQYFEIDGKSFELHYVDHHMSHAAGAYYCSPFDNALVITLDGGGDGLDGGAYIGQGSSLKNLFEIPHFQSPGTMYSAVTHDLGFKRHRHEGKITGLAAYGNDDLERLGLHDLIKYNKSKHRFVSKKIAAHHRNLKSNSNYFYPLLEKFGREDLAAAAQKMLENEVLEFVKDAYDFATKQGYKIDKVCLAGGVFANVKLNQRILHLDFVDNIFVYPAMGDDGLSGGAALYTYYQLHPNEPKSKATIEEIYRGGDFTDAEIKAALDEAGLDYERFDDVETEIGKILADLKVVGRFNGAMEYGPRALGNRSIIAAPFDPSINDWLNKKLNRTEFMPFAPSILEEDTKEYFPTYREDHIAADFMTVTYDVNKGLQEKIPAVVHIDGTARPQVVRTKTNPSYHKIISEFKKHTGVPVVLNTSYNIHEQPIVYTPGDAIKGFLEGKLDVLAIGNYICHAKQTR